MSDKKEMSETQVAIQKQLIDKHLKSIGLKKKGGRFIAVRSKKRDFLMENHPDLLDPYHLLP